MDPNQLVNFLAFFVIILGRLIVYAIIARIIMSWLMVSQRSMRHGKFAMMLIDVTEPIIRLARKIPHRIGMFDFAPIIAIIAIDLSVELVSKLLLNLA